MITKIKQLIIGGITYDARALAVYLLSFIIGTKPTPVKELRDDELLTKIAEGISLIRFGDGEAMLMTGRDIHYQPTSTNLSNDLSKILQNYTKDSPYLIGVAAYALTATDEELKTKERFRIWRLFRVFFPLRFPINEYFYCLVYFYRKGNFENKVAPLLKDKHVICVANKNVLDATLQTYLTDYFNTADFVFAPPENAYAHKSEITAQINEFVQKYPASSCCILLAAGPASKVIAYEYAERGIQALDVGHGMEIIGRHLDYTSRI